MQPVAGFWAFTWLCIKAAEETTRAFFGWNMKTVLSGVLVLFAGFLFFRYRRGHEATKTKVEDYFLISLAPLGAFVALLFVFNLIRSSYLVYTAEYAKAKQSLDNVQQHANALEQENVGLASALAIEKDKSQPKFEIGWASSAVGEGYEIENGHRENLADVYIQVSVLNRGAPGVINGCKGIVHLTDGTELESFPYEPSEAHVSVRGPHGRVRLPTSPSLLKVWAITPIPTGGRGVGYVLFKFPPGTKKKMYGPGGGFVIKIWDINGREYRSEIPWSSNPPKDILSLPGMAPTR